MRLVWLTDIHINFVTELTLERLMERVRDEEPDAVLIGGDIAEGHDILGFLERLERGLQRPIYFVLGNHDYYLSSISRVRRDVEHLCSRSRSLRFLTRSGFIALTDRLALVGHDGWGDGREGDFVGTPVTLADHQVIEELRGLERSVLASSPR